MSFSVTLDPPAVAAHRQELDLMSGSILTDQRGIDWGDAAIAASMGNEQKWGATPISFRVPNRTIVIPLLLSSDSDASYDQAWDRLRQKVAIMQREGGWIKRDSGRGLPVYADVVNASLKAPDQYGHASGIEPNIELHLECLPDFYGDIITLDTITAAGDNAAVLQFGGSQAVIQGDHPGRVQVIVSDVAPISRYGLVWGFRSRNYDAVGTSRLLWTAGQLSLASGASLVADAAAHGGTAIKKTSGASGWQDIAYLDGSHVGSYQLWGRLRTDVASIQLEDMWSIGDTGNEISAGRVPFTVAQANQAGIIGWPALAAPGSSYYMVNLGQVRMDIYPAGAQKWRARIQAYIPSGGSVWLDSLMMVPLDESAGAVRGTYSADPAIVSGGRMVMRYDGILRNTPSGTAFKPVAETYGDFPRIPPSGMEGRTVELVTKLSRGDLGSNPDTALDAYEVIVSYRPTYLFRP